MTRLPNTRENTALSTFERVSLIVLWWGTAAVSLWGFQGISQDLVRQATWIAPNLVAPLVIAGIATDACMGAWLWLKPSAHAVRASFLVVLVLTLLATLITPTQWLHPFGPLLKNIPILAMLWRACQWQQRP